MLTTIEKEEATATFRFMADDHVSRQTYLRCEVEDSNGNVQFAKHTRWSVEFDEKAIVGELRLLYVHHGAQILLSRVRFYYRERQLGERTVPSPLVVRDNESVQCSRYMRFEFQYAE